MTKAEQIKIYIYKYKKNNIFMVIILYPLPTSFEPDN